MLDMGFIRDIRKILAVLPARRQNLLFSATFSDDIRRLADDFLDAPASVQVSHRNQATDLVTQVVHPVDRERKRELLSHLIKSGRIDQALVFTRTKHGANRLATQLEHDGILRHGHPRQQEPAAARSRAGRLQGRPVHGPRGDRSRRARHRHRRAAARRQLRAADGARGLRPPDRSDRAGRRRRRCRLARVRRRAQAAPRDRAGPGPCRSRPRRSRASSPIPASARSRSCAAASAAPDRWAAPGRWAAARTMAVPAPHGAASRRRLAGARMTPGVRRVLADPRGGQHGFDGDRVWRSARVRSVPGPAGRQPAARRHVTPGRSPRCERHRAERGAASGRFPPERVPRTNGAPRPNGPSRPDRLPAAPSRNGFPAARAGRVRGSATSHPAVQPGEAGMVSQPASRPAGGPGRPSGARPGHNGRPGPTRVQLPGERLSRFDGGRSGS